MSKPKRFADVRRALIRRLDRQPDHILVELRDELWDRLITRQFMAGTSIENVAESQPSRSKRWDIESAIRRQARKRAPKWMR